MTCSRCVARVKDWRGDDPVCGFDEAGAFVARNWNCATLNELRDLVEDDGPGVRLWHDDENVGVLAMPVRLGGGFLLLRWYKRRGCTESVLVWDGGILPRPVTLAEAEAVLGWLGPVR